MTPKRLLVATLLAGILGVALMIPFEGPLTRSLGTTCLIAFCVLGAFLIASPGYLAEEEDDP